MPGGNKTGPLGMGPRTGRHAGYCAGFDASGSRRGDVSGMTGRSACCHGGGRGWRHWFHATGQPGWMRNGNQTTPMPESVVQESEIQALTRRADELQQELSAIQQKLQMLPRSS